MSHPTAFTEGPIRSISVWQIPAQLQPFTRYLKETGQSITALQGAAMEMHRAYVAHQPRIKQIIPPGDPRLTSVSSMMFVRH